MLTVEEHKKEYDKIWDDKRLRKEKDEKFDKTRKKFREELEHYMITRIQMIKKDDNSLLTN